MPFTFTTALHDGEELVPVVFILDKHDGLLSPTIMATNIRYDSPEDEAFVKAQFQEAKNTGKVTCECGACIPLRFVYRCYFCDGYFCGDCAPLHFGKTREEWINERDARRAAQCRDETVQGTGPDAE